MTEKTYPKLTRAKVTISYRADDGYSSEVTYGDLRGDSDPKQVLLEAHRETARLLTLFNFEAEARAIAEEAHTATRACFPERPALENEGDTFRALVSFILHADEPMSFLRAWNEGDFDTCRREWPEAPESVYPSREGGAK